MTVGCISFHSVANCHWQLHCHQPPPSGVTVEHSQCHVAGSTQSVIVMAWQSRCPIFKKHSTIKPLQPPLQTSETQRHHRPLRGARPPAPSHWLLNIVDVKTGGVRVKVSQQVQRRPFFYINKLVCPVACVSSAAVSAITVIANILHIDLHTPLGSALYQDFQAAAKQFRVLVVGSCHSPRPDS